MLVYVIGPEGGPFKIGLTGDLSKRLCELQSGNPTRLHVHAVREVANRVEARAAEAEVHRKLSATRMTGEWFSCSLDEALDAVGRDEATVREIVGSAKQVEELAAQVRAMSEVTRLRLAGFYGSDDASPEALAIAALARRMIPAE